MKHAIVDLTHTLSTSDLIAYASAQQRQLREDYASHYDGDGASDVFRVATDSHDIALDERPCFVWPHVPAGGPDGALGYHDRTPDGRPICNVFLDLAKKYGDTWQSIMSHEVLEARADPRLHICVELDNGEIWDREICDRVEADSYLIDGVPMSNFNTPACFEPMVASQGEPLPAEALASDPGASATTVVKPAPHVPHSPPKPKAQAEVYDHLNKSTKPNEVRPGGYAQKYDPQRGWTQVGQMRGYREHLAKLGLGRPEKRKRRPNPSSAQAVAAMLSQP